MRSRLSKRRMEDYGGDLADVVRAAAALPDWSFIPSSDTIGYAPDLADRDFGDPFRFTGDPLLQKADPDPVVAGFFYDSGAVRVAAKDLETGRSSCVGSAISRRREADYREQIVKAPSASVFSRMLQNDAKLPAVDPTPPPVGLPRVSEVPAPVALPNNNKENNDRTFISPASGMEISSPRNTGIKRRKCQAKKVVCIPAPAPANSRASGEVVPSDLWAWRKYGQKPIKGSPYPRGYYRCSSSKGCSARKQVERSRTDPNMLVITYTSDHNHPWPTQRNALAGSTRSLPSKPTNKTGPTQSDPPKESDASADTILDVKDDMKTDHRRESSNDWSGSADFFDDECDGFIPDGPTLELSEDSFFADLGEIEAEALDELFARGFCGDGSKDLDPFGFYDWAADGCDTAAAAAAAPIASSAASCRDDDLGNS